MSDVIPLGDQTRPRDHRNIRDELSEQLSEIYAVASLLAAVDCDNIFIGQINATGHLLTRMIAEAEKLSEEHMKLWREEIAESQRD
jgi:hypothetical protein